MIKVKKQGIRKISLAFLFYISASVFIFYNVMQWQVVHLQQTESTNEFAKNNLSAFSLPAVVYTDYQTKGKGQQSNIWHSAPKKNLLCSIILPMQIPIECNNYISRYISVVLIDLLKKLNVPEGNVKIKWPNDIIISTAHGYKKIAGILIENIIEKKYISKSIIGVGLNVNQTEFGQYNRIATSVKSVTNQEYHIDHILSMLTAIIEEYFSLLQFQKYTNINQLYIRYLYGWQTEFLFKINQDIHKGKITQILDDGKISISTPEKEYVFSNKQIQFLL